MLRTSAANEGGKLDALPSQVSALGAPWLVKDEGVRLGGACVKVSVGKTERS